MEVAAAQAFEQARSQRSPSSPPDLTMYFEATVGRYVPAVGMIMDDLRRINFNPFNTNTYAVIESNIFSFYRGSPVIRHDIGTGSAAIFGTIWLNNGVDNTDFGWSHWVIAHEWGHNIQERILGLPLYIALIAIPSLLSSSRDNHHCMPWEKWADWLARIFGSEAINRHSPPCHC